MVEAASCNVNIISSDCKNGPEEFLLNGKLAFYLKIITPESLNKAFDKFINSSEENYLKKGLLPKNR